LIVWRNEKNGLSLAYQGQQATVKATGTSMFELAEIAEIMEIVEMMDAMDD
jgi:hypothetical protein